MVLNFSFLRLTSAALFVCVSACSALAQTAAQRTALASTVSIGDALHQQDQKASTSNAAILPPPPPPLNGAKAIVSAAPPNTPPPVHLLYVHGINEIGPNDSAKLRHSLCAIYKACAPPRQPPETIYAEGPFSLDAPHPTLTYLGQAIWSKQEEWNASTPFIHRYRISRHAGTPIVLDEINWYPLVYPLKCKFLLPGDASLTGSIESFQKVCVPSTQPDPTSAGHFLAYPFPADQALFVNDLSVQHATSINHTLKLNVMDWGFGDAAMALGPMSEILTAAIRQLLLQSMQGLSDGPSNGDIPTFFVTHSLGSYLSLAAMDSDWPGALTPQLTQFGMSPEQTAAADHFAKHTTGFYFLANQVSLLELARLVQPASQPDQPQPNPTGPVPAATALTHYADVRMDYIKQHPESAGNAPKPQIIAWSAADDLLSWYVPNIPNIVVVNLAAHNSGFRLPWLFAWPTSVHDDYAENKAIVKIIFGPK